MTANKFSVILYIRTDFRHINFNIHLFTERMIEMTNKRLVITDKKRFTAFCTVMAIICVCAIAAIFPANNSVSASDTEYEIIYVGTGDTLWSIARENYSQSTDIRSAIADIKYLNGMTTNTIYPGDVLYIPVY